MPAAGEILLNAGREPIRLQVTNLADHPIQVGSHYHFVETNPYLRFDRSRAYGRRLDIPAGMAVRFEPGETRTVQLVERVGVSAVPATRLASVQRIRDRSLPSSFGRSSRFLRLPGLLRWWRDR